MAPPLASPTAARHHHNTAQLAAALLLLPASMFPRMRNGREEMEYWG